MDVDIAEWIVKIPVLLFSITIHEYAHGRAACALGDPTARNLGRLTLNPLPHIDPIGALCLFLFNFGWAKPVPIDSRYFKRFRRDTILVSLAGPLSNFLLALMAGLAIPYVPMDSEILVLTAGYLLFMNLGLALFNLIPLPPLDGSHILENSLSPSAALKYREWGRFGPMVLMGIVLLDNVAHTGILNLILVGPMRYLAGLFSGIPF